jgi:hypothetical protein
MDDGGFDEAGLVPGLVLVLLLADAVDSISVSLTICAEPQRLCCW